jgi:hypothetical protein
VVLFLSLFVGTVDLIAGPTKCKCIDWFFSHFNTQLQMHAAFLWRQIIREVYDREWYEGNDLEEHGFDLFECTLTEFY